jgi:hypothetical protein
MVQKKVFFLERGVGVVSSPQPVSSDPLSMGTKK